MGRSQGSHHARNRIAAGLLALCVAGCNGNHAWQVSSVGAPPLPAPSATLSITTTGGGFFGALFALGMLGAASGALYHRDPDMDPDRRIVEQDCTRPIEDHSANLRCR